MGSIMTLQMIFPNEALLRILASRDVAEMLCIGGAIAMPRLMMSDQVFLEYKPSVTFWTWKWS